MRIKLDENVPVDGVDLLAGLGHDVETVLSESLTGSDDKTIVAAASREQRLLITLDRGMGDIRTYSPGSHAGIVVLRLADHSADSTLAALRSLAEHHDLNDFVGCNVVVRSHLVRVRRPK